MRAHLLDLNDGVPNRGTAALRGQLEHAGFEVDTWDVRQGGGLPPAEAGVWVLGGGPGSPLQAGAWREPLLDALRARVAADRPTLCICYGFEMLGAAMGSDLRRLATPREGVYPVRLVAHDPALEGLDGHGAWEARSWAVFGDFGRVFARGPELDVAGTRLGDHVLGVIFHPEADLGPETHAVYSRVVPRYLASLR